MAATIKSIAEATGLSNQTVSFVLGKKAHLFRPETQELVRKTAQRMGYRPNASARAMRSGRANAMAVLLSTDSGRSTMFAGFLKGVEAVAHAGGMHLVVTALPDAQLTDERFVPKILRETLADGLLINYYLKIPAALEALVARHHIPAIWTNARRNADCVFPDDFGASLAATRTLIQKGYRRIGYADCTHAYPFDRARDHYSAFDRLAGYREAMQEAGLPVTELLSPRELAGVAVTRAVWDWLAAPDRPDAIVTYCDVDAFGVLQAAMALGLSIPQDLALTSFSETALMYGMTPVTTMLIPSQTLGSVAAKMLKEKMADPARMLAPRPVEFGVYEAESSDQ